jgi:uncharacterized protein
VLRPDVQVERVSDVSTELLRTLGIEGVLLDLDDTIVASDAALPTSEVEAWLRDLLRSGIKVVILSNGERGRVRDLSQRLGVSAFALVGKPLWFAFRRGLRALGTPRHATAMVGDQLFTDVFGANVAGLTSILVRPLTPGKLPHTRLARRLERLILTGRDRSNGGERGRPVDR